MHLGSIGLIVIAALVGCGSPADDNTTVAGTTSSGGTTEPVTETSSSTVTDASMDSSSSSSTTSTSITTESSSSSDATVDESSSSSGTTESGPPRVVFETTLGTIVFELDEVAAPITSGNFLTYVDGGFFDGTDGDGATIFHRVIPGFVIQGGGLTETLDQKATLPPITNEFGNGLLNVRGSISMARTMDPDSATSQFFINLVDNGGLDVPPGYAVFGAVVEGMDVVDTMAGVQTTTMGQYDDVPVEPIIVISATRE